MFSSNPSHIYYYYYLLLLLCTICNLVFCRIRKKSNQTQSNRENKHQLILSEEKRELHCITGVAFVIIKINMYLNLRSTVQRQQQQQQKTKN